MATKRKAQAWRQIVDGPCTMTVRVLVVDDEPNVETLFRQEFRREMREALDLLDDASGEKIILLVSDINMPGMSGLDLLPIVKTRRPDLPVFMISAYSDADTVATALARGANEFFKSRSSNRTSWR